MPSRKWLLILLVPIFFILIIFSRFFFKGEIPIPTDILAGAYYPWFDYSFGYPAHVPIKNPLPSDVVSIIYPWRALGIEIFKSGHLPLWDDTILLGVPLLANFQSALLNPFNILFFIFPHPIAWGLEVIIQPLLVFIAMFLFLKTIKLSTQASTVASLLYSFSGFVLVWLEYNSLIYTLIYVPLIFLLLELVSTKPQLKLALILGIVICLQIFSGYPLITIYTLIFGLIYFFWQYGQNRTNFSLKLGTLILGVMTGLGLGAVQLLPGQELTSLSIRAFDQSALAGNIKYLSPAQSLTFFIPDLYGNPATGNFWAEGSFDNLAFFLPTAGVVLLLISLISGNAWKKDRRIYLIFIILGLVLATKNFISQEFSQLNLLGLNSAVNTRVLFLVCFAGATLGGFMFDDLKKTKLRLTVLLLPLGLYLAILIGFFITYLRVRNLSIQVENLYSIVPKDNRLAFEGIEGIRAGLSAALAGYQVSFKNMILPFLIVILTTLSLSFKSKKILFVILLFLIFISTKVSFDKYLTFTKAELFYPPTAATDHLIKRGNESRFLTEDAELLPQNSWTPYLLSSPNGQNNLAPLNITRYLNLINNSNLNDALLTRYNQVSNLGSPLVNTLNVGSIVMLNHKPIESIPDKTGQPFAWLIKPEWKETGNFDTVRIYQNQANLGPAWFSQNVICESNINKTAQILTDKKYRPQENIVIDCRGTFQNLAPGSVSLTKQLPNFREFKLTTPVENYLTISLTHYPGWQAFLGGEKVDIKPANLALMGVLIPKGDHTLELFYQPDSFKNGLIITGITVGIWILLLGLKKFMLKWR
ncbi:MAG: YfhO family protein [Candidatus Daviesbacteria bacterium]|nr:MAG: YfhO family protein [Candidatus Daviesbacteria bacterium]